MHKSYWENIIPKRLVAYIDALPAKHELLYFARTVADGLMREMDPVSQFRYARVREGTMRYLVESQQEKHVASLELLYDPFFFTICKLFPGMKTGTFAVIFQHFIRFASANERIPTAPPDEVTTLIQDFLGRIQIE